MIEPVPTTRAYSESELATCLEATAGLLAPVAWMHDQSLALRVLQDIQRGASSARLRDAAQFIVDLWAAAQEPALANVVRGDLPYSEAPAAPLVDGNVIYLNRRPVVGMIPEANRTWDPLHNSGEEGGR